MINHIKNIAARADSLGASIYHLCPKFANTSSYTTNNLTLIVCIWIWLFSYEHLKQNAIDIIFWWESMKIRPLQFRTFVPK